MARIRIIRPEFWDDEKMARISRDARLLFIGFWTNSDDYGVIKGNHYWLKSRIFPYDNVDVEVINKWINELLNIGVIQKFEADGAPYYFIKNFARHQIIEKPSKVRNPAPPIECLSGGGNSAICQRLVGDESETNRRREDDLIEIEKEIEKEKEKEIEKEKEKEREKEKNHKPLTSSAKTKKSKTYKANEELHNPPTAMLKEAFEFWQKMARLNDKVILPKPGRSQFERLKGDLANGYRFVMREKENGTPDWEATHQDILEAIKALAEILADPSIYWFTYAPDIGAFFRQRNLIPKFLPDAQPKKQFLKRGQNYREDKAKPKSLEQWEIKDITVYPEEQDDGEKLKAYDKIKNLKETKDREKLLKKLFYFFDNVTYKEIAKYLTKTLTTEEQPGTLFLETSNLNGALCLSLKIPQLLTLKYADVKDFKIVVYDGEAWRIFKE